MTEEEWQEDLLRRAEESACAAFSALNAFKHDVRRFSRVPVRAPPCHLCSSPAPFLCAPARSETRTPSPRIAGRRCRVHGCPPARLAARFRRLTRACSW